MSLVISEETFNQLLLKEVWIPVERPLLILTCPRQVGRQDALAVLFRYLVHVERARAKPGMQMDNAQPYVNLHEQVHHKSAMAVLQL